MYLYASNLQDSPTLVCEISVQYSQRFKTVMDKILVQWTDGRSKGTTSFVKRSTIKEGTVAVGKKVKVTWGKAKKSYNAEVLSVGNVPPAPPTPRGKATTEDEPFTFQLAAAAPRAQSQPTSRADQLEIEALADAVAGFEARLLRRLQMLEDKLTALQQEVLEKCKTPLPPPPAALPPPPPAASTGQEPQTPAAPPPPSLAAPPPPSPAATTLGSTPAEFLQETPTAAALETLALRDVTSRCNVTATSTQGSYAVPTDVVATVLFGCKSRRNLAARLAAKIFSLQERQGSNCRGVLGKTPLDVFRVKAIYAVCMHHFPLQRLETQLMADKEMRTAIDEVCRKTKCLPTDRENCEGSLV